MSGMFLLASIAAIPDVVTGAEPIVKFGIITDLHYADANTGGSRHYRDSLPKMREALQTISDANADFQIELGDFKDMDASQHCAGQDSPSDQCINTTTGFLRKIEEEMLQGFEGPKYHVFGNHDVDILTQPQVVAEEHNTDEPAHPIISGDVSEGYFAFNAPVSSPGPDTIGCLVSDGRYIWILHDDGSRNWVNNNDACVVSQALRIQHDEINVFPGRHGNLDANASAKVCQTSAACVAGELPKPLGQHSLRFLVLNGDFTDRDVPWYDIDGPHAQAEDMAWTKGNVPTRQLTWLASQLSAAKAAGQKVVVFVHFRLDGGMGTGAEMSCTLQNAAVVRAVLESEPGLVLATFSGHDHAAKPSYTHFEGKPVYVTLKAMVEGSFEEGHNAYSVVSIMSDCSVVVRGYGDQPNITVPGPSGCNFEPGSSVV